MRRRLITATGVCLATVGLAACGSSHSAGTASSAPAVSGTTRSATTHGSGAVGSAGPTQPGGGTVGPEGIVIEQGASLAPASTTSKTRQVDGIRCAPVESLKYHIHAHLQVYVNGQPRQLPGAIGILGPVNQGSGSATFYGASECYYWLHTHTADGILHVESPTATTYTLGDFFDEWGQPLGADVVATAHGPVTAFVNGKRWTKSVRDIPLISDELIQLDVGQPVVPFRPVSLAGSGL